MAAVVHRRRGATARVLSALRVAFDVWRSPGTFHHRGVRFWHVGLLLDQGVAAEVVDDVAAGLAKKHPIGRVEALLARTTVHLTRERPRLGGVATESCAEWSGGLFERGRVRLRYADGWPDQLTQALGALLLAELAPDEREPVGAGVGVH